MNRRWRYLTVAGTFWRDRSIRKLPDDGRMLAIYLLTCPDKTTEGFYSLQRVNAMDDLKWDADRLTGAFIHLALADFAHYDDDAEVVFIVKGLKYNPPRGIKSIQGALTAMETVQDAPDLFRRFLAAADGYAPDFSAAIRKRYDLK